ncbi:hypothetical protein [Kordia sp.]|uniref:hypothetical protein n=1 Tax=Kordia sp. TaxID=1965332 RepID=UPI003D2E295C
MKKERKQKLIISKVKISQLNTLYGGSGENIPVASIVLCTVDDQTGDLVCQATNYLTCDDPNSGTGATKTNRSLVNCIVSAQC